MFKKFLAYLLIISLLLPALPVQAEGIYKMVGSGAVTQPNMKISTVNGTTFIDFSDSEAAANKLINHKGYLLKVRDSSKRAIQGYVKAAGTGETLGSEIIINQTDRDFSGANNWINGNLLAFNASGDLTITANATWQNCSLATIYAPLSVGVLTRFTVDVANYVNAWDIKSADNSNQYAPGTILSNGSKSYTFTNTSPGGFKIWAIADNSSADFDNFSLKQVLTPSATGVTITSTKGGSTFNFAALDSAFNYNDASGYTYELWQVNNAVEVASGSIAAGEMLADTTATNAHVAPVGVNLSAYQTGKYIFATCNTVGGYGAFGYIMGTAPGGETLGAEIVTNGDFSSDTANWVSHTTPYECTLASIAGGQAGNCLELTESGAVNQSWAEQLRASLNVSSLYKLSGYIKSGTSGSEDGGISLAREAFDGGNWLTLSATTTASWSQLSGYYTLTVPTINVTINKLTTTAGTMLFDTISFKNVTDCAATGALIVSAKDGATRAWAYKHASFNPNLASTYKIFYVGD